VLDYSFPEPANGENGGYVSVTGSSDSDVWAGEPNYSNYLAHFDGTAWTRTPGLGDVGFGNVGLARSGYYTDIDGNFFTSHDANACVDTCALGSGHVRSDGTTIDELPGCITAVRGQSGGIYARTPDDVWAIMGVQTGPSDYATYVMHITGGVCSAQVLPSPSTQPEPSYDTLVGLGATDIWAFGGQAAAHFDGTTWTATAVDFEAWDAVAGKSGVWALGWPRSGNIYHLEQGNWVATNPFQVDLSALWMNDDGTVYAAGANGAILKHAATSP